MIVIFVYFQVGASQTMPQPLITIRNQRSMHGKSNKMLDISPLRGTKELKAINKLNALCSDKIHGLEYPPGERIIIKYSGETKSNIDCRQPIDGIIFNRFLFKSLPTSLRTDIV